ncbi:hypothetical protein A2U01_0099911, partial [Trifolium medium]|nr:hypothetical protein [Trifolium medium]
PGLRKAQLGEPERAHQAKAGREAARHGQQGCFAQDFTKIHPSAS